MFLYEKVDGKNSLQLFAFKFQNTLLIHKIYRII